MYERLANSIQCSKAVTHPSTDGARRCLTWVIVWSLVCSILYGRWQRIEALNVIFEVHTSNSDISGIVMVKVITI